MTPRLPEPDNLDNLIERYLAGESRGKLAAAWHVSGSTISRWLTEAGIQLRDKSAAGLIRAAHEDPAIMERRIAGSRAARTGRRISDATMAKRARSKAVMQTYIGKYEREVVGWLRERGLTVETQVPVDRYNLDIAFGSTAVEIHHNARHPTLERTVRRRTVHLINAGWNVIYVWVHPEKPMPPTGRTWDFVPHGVFPSVADRVIAVAEEMCSDPAPIGKYRVLGGDGQDRTRGSRDSYKGARRPSPFHDLLWLG